MIDNDLINQAVKFLKSEGINSWDEMSKGDQGLWIGVFVGWWEWVDWKRKAPIPFPLIFNVFNMPKNLKMSHILNSLGVFKSIKKAKEAGWDKPVTLGEFFFFNRTVRVLIISCEDEK